MITEAKVTKIFCMADDFCKFFDAMTAKYTLKPTGNIIEILQCAHSTVKCNTRVKISQRQDITSG